MLSPKHKQEIKKLLQKVYQHPSASNRKKNSPAERFLSGNSAPSFGSQNNHPSRQPHTSLRGTSSASNTNRPAPRSGSQRSAAASNERTSIKMATDYANNLYSSSQLSGPSPSGNPSYQLVLQGQQGDPRFSINSPTSETTQHLIESQFLHKPREESRQQKGPATYDSNTLKQLLAEAGEAAASQNPEQLFFQNTQHQYIPAPQFQKEAQVGLRGNGVNEAFGDVMTVHSVDSELAECEQEAKRQADQVLGKEYRPRGSEQLKNALFDYYLHKELSRHRDSPRASKREEKTNVDNKDSEAEVEQIQRHFAPDILSELGLLTDSNESDNGERSEREMRRKELKRYSDKSVDLDPLPDPPFIDEERPPYYNERIEQELLQFKIEIEQRFKNSEINRYYRFPRTEENYVREEEVKRKRKKEEERRKKEEKIRRKQEQAELKRQEVERKWKAIANEAIEAAKVAATMEARRILIEEEAHRKKRRNNAKYYQYDGDDLRNHSRPRHLTSESPKRQNKQSRRGGAHSQHGLRGDTFMDTGILQMPSYMNQVGNSKRSPLPDFDEFLVCQSGTLSSKSGGGGGGIHALMTLEPEHLTPYTQKEKHIMQKKHLENSGEKGTGYSPGSGKEARRPHSTRDMDPLHLYAKSATPSQYSKMSHNKNKTYEFPVEMLKSLSQEVMESEMHQEADRPALHSTTDKYQKTIDFSKLASSTYRREPSQQRSDSSKRTKTAQQHMRGHSMTIGGINHPYYRSISSTKHGGSSGSNPRSSGYSAQKAQNYTSINNPQSGRRSELVSKKVPQSTKEATRPRSLKLAFQPVNSSGAQRAITISSGGTVTSSIQSTVKKPSKGDVDYARSVARQHAFQQVPPMNLNATTNIMTSNMIKSSMSKMQSNGPPSARSISQRPPSNRAQRVVPPESTRKSLKQQVGYSSKPRVMNNHTMSGSSSNTRTIFDSSLGSTQVPSTKAISNHKLHTTTFAQTHNRSKTALADSYQEFMQKLSPSTSSKKKPSERQNAQLKPRIFAMTKGGVSESLVIRQTSQSAMAGSSSTQPTKRGNSQMRQREPLQQTSGGVTIMPWTVNPSQKLDGKSGVKGKPVNKSHYYQHARTGAVGGKTVPEKFATLKKELSKINQNLKQTIKRMNSGSGANTRSAMNSSRDMHRESSAEGELNGRERVGGSSRNEAKIRISELLNSQR